MRKHQFGRKIAAVAMAAVMTVSAAFSGGVGGTPIVHAAPAGAPVPERQDSASIVNYSSILGRATDYGIVAENFKQMNHMQTTFAVKNYSSLKGDANDINLLAKEQTGHSMLGRVDLDNCGGAGPVDEYSTAEPQQFAKPAQPVKIGSITSDTFVFEGPQSWLDSSYVNVDNVKTRPGFKFKYNEGIMASIDVIIDRAYNVSDTLEAKCKDPEYKLDYTKYMLPDGKTLDVTGDAFENKVVYIDVDSNLLSKLAEAEGLYINKNDSTVIVFNVSDDAGTNFMNKKVRLGKYGVSVDGSPRYMTDKDDPEIDQYICQKIIWNITTTKDVQLCNTAGLVIVPNANTDIRNTSRGWIVAKNLVNSFGEWHYIYKGISQYVNEDNLHQMHLSFRKAFTRDWKGSRSTETYTIPDEDSSVYFEAGDYSFEFYETGADYNTSGKKATVIKNEATSYVKTPSLTFYASQEEADKDTENTYKYVIPTIKDQSNSKEFYYVIKEANAGQTINNVEVSTGYINIKVVATNKNGEFSYVVSSDTYLGDQNHSKTASNKDVIMSGFDFDLDAFYNKIGKTVVIDKVAIADGPEIGGAKLTIKCEDDKVYPFTMFTTSAKRDDGTDVKLSFGDNSGAGVVGFKSISYTTEAGKHTVINGLSDGNYTLTETTTPNGFKTAETIRFSVRNGVVSSNNADVNANVITMIDDHITDVDISKVIAGGVKELEGARLTLTAEDKNGKEIDISKNTVKLGKGASRASEQEYNGKGVQFISGSEATTIKALPDGEYTLHEDAAPDGYKVSTDITFSISEGVVIGKNVTVTAGENAKVTMADAVKDVPLANVDISKVIAGGSAELEGAKLTLTGKDANGKTIDISRNGVQLGENADRVTNPDYTGTGIQFISGKTATTIKDLPDGTYTLQEEAAPYGYATASQIIFTVENGVVKPGKCVTAAEGDQNAVVTMQDAALPKTDVDISKEVLGVAGEELPGATLTLTGVDSKNNEIVLSGNTVKLGKGATQVKSPEYKGNGIQFVSGTTPTSIVGLYDGTYTLHEEAAPNGYSVATNITFVIENGAVKAGDCVTEANGGKNAVVTMADQALPTADVDISKVIAGGSTELPGAVLTLTNNDTKVDISDNTVKLGDGAKRIDSYSGQGIQFISGKTPTTIKNLPDGTYTLHENTAPLGYNVSTDIEFTIKDGKVLSGTSVKAATDSTNAVVVMEDALKPKADVDISKVIAGGSTELEGAKLTLIGIDSNKNPIDISGNEVTLGDGAKRVTAPDYDGKGIQYISGTKPTTIKGLPDGTYTLYEEAAPNGYAVASEIVFTVKDGKVQPGNCITVATGDENAVVTMEDAANKTNVDISKEAAGVAGKELPGAKLTLTGTDYTGAAVTFNEADVTKGTNARITATGECLVFISGETPTTVKNLPDGTYKLEENVAPNGYTVATEITFEIKNGVVSGAKVTAASAGKNAKVTMEDAASKADVDISKEAAGVAGKELPGAELTLTGTDYTGTAVTFDEADVTKGTNAKVTGTGESLVFISGETPTTVKNLPDGTYKLKESAAPNGYTVATEITFKITNGVVTGAEVTAATADKNAKVTMEDAASKTDVDISKEAVGAAGKELSGAKLTLTGTDYTGKKVTFSETDVTKGTNAKIEGTGESLVFISGETPTTVKNLPDGTYKLKENAAPKGYKVATEITFEIKNGVVTGAEVTAATADKNAKVTMQDAAEAAQTVKISKIATDTGLEKAGATIVITDEDGDEVEKWTSTTETHEFQLLPGKYELAETAAPEGYELIQTTIKFEVDSKGVVTVTSKDTTGIAEVVDGKLVIYNEPKAPDKKTIKVSKVDASDLKEIGGAKIEVYNDKNEKVADWTSKKDESHELSLVPGTYVLKETAAPEGYEPVHTDITFTVDNDGKVTLGSAVTDGDAIVDSNGKLIIKNSRKNTVKVSKVDAGTGEELEGAEIVLVDVDGKTVDSWTSEKTPHELTLTPGTYTIKETTAPSGYDTVKSDITFTVKADGTVTLDKAVTTGVAELRDDGTILVKDEPQKGSLVITKSFAKDCITEAEKEGGLQFTVTTKIGEDTFYLTSDGKLTDTKTIFTLNPDFTYDSDSNSWSKKFENVPIGTYTVEEVNTEVAGYKFKGSTYNGVEGTKGEITVEADKETAEKIVDEYEQVASLTVKKSVTDSEAAAAAASKKYKIALKDADGKFYNGTEFTTSAKYFDVTTAGSVTFKDLPVGKTYTIVEDFGESNAKVNITGFTFKGFTAAPVDLTQDATVTVTNDYTRDKGNLVIKKLVKGPVTEDEFNGALTFSITDKNGKAIAVTKNDGTTGTSENMTIKDYFKPVSSGNKEFKYELVIENVPTDTYTVTETNSTFDGYELVSKTGGGKTTVVKGEDAVSNFVDEYKQVTGSLEIVKNFKDAPSNLDASKIVFKVSGPKLFNNGEDLTVTYDKFTSGKYVIDNAPIGEYTVTETSYEDSKIDGNYKYTFSTGASTVTGKTTVIKDTKATVTLLNVYDKEEILGSLTISKAVAMNDGSEVPADTFVSDKTFRVSVQNTDTGLYVSTETGKYSEQPVWFDIKAGSPVVIKNIKLGNYTVSEDVADATAVDYRIIYVGSASVSEGTATLTTDARDGSVALSNVYKHYEKEDIIDYPVFFSKEDSLSGAEVAGATIELYKGDKAEGTPVSTWISTLTSHVENLEPGTYTFKETVAPKGYDIVEKAITFTVDKDDSEKGYSVKLIDLSDEVCYQRKDGTLVLKDDPMLGILKVVKVVETDTGNKPVVNGFNVTVKNLKNNKYVTSIDGTLGDEAADIFVPIDSTGVGSVEITGLRPAKYLVIEKEGDKALKGFIYDANGSIAELEEEITLTDKGATTAEIELANKYFENIGNLEITKKVTGDDPGKSEFEVTVTNEDGKFVTADGKLSDDKTVLTVKVGETLTIKNIPSGKYTVSEDLTDAADVTGFKFNSENSVSAKDATVTQGATAAVELINDYTEVPTGHLYVHVTEEKSGLDVPDATVTVTNKTTGETTEFKTNSKGEIVDDNGLTPELPVGDYTVVVSEVPEGYEVTTGESADITVPKNDTAKHEAVIKTVRGGIIITVYDEETGEVVSGAKVTITTPDGVTDTFVTNAKGQVDEYGKKDAFGNYTQVPGTFTYVVTEVPAGYKVTVGESQTGTVVADELTKLIAKIAPRTGGLDITVLDEKTEKAVPDAKVEVVTPDGTKYELITDKNGMITKFAEKDATGKYTAKVGEYKITVTTVPEGYTVTTGQTKSETVEEGKVKHHVAKIAPSKKITITDTKTDTTKTNTKTDTKKTDTNAKTGDVTSVAGILAMMIISLAAIGFIIRRKKEDEK